jgi:leucyl aminopeptidase
MTKLLSFVLLLSFSAFASDDYLYVTMGSDAASTANKVYSNFDKMDSAEGVTVAKIHKDDVPALSGMMHHTFQRCGGFIVHNSKEEALETLHNVEGRKFAKNFDFIDYTITEGERVENMVSMVQEFGIRSTIEKLSSFKNRYYKADTGVQSQAWIKSHWEKLSQGRSDVKVEYYKHSKWPQPSVVMTIEGTTRADEIIVIGGHADSIAGFWGGARARAPGADDNASGIATITEVIKISMDSSYTPTRTIKFMAYAAEEVGLLGSKEIAGDFKKAGKRVVGVLQLDMTNFKGSKNYDIVFMEDYTNAAQNKYLGKLIDTYVKVPWGYSKCGYGCSDHASWHNQGFPASIPFESTKGDMNNKIHTSRDLIDVSGSTADHAAKFAKLAVAYLVEMGK